MPIAPDPPGPDAAPGITDYGFLSDCHSAALVSTGGSIDWWCLPRFDSPSVFARLLDPAAGHWTLAPVGEFTSTRDYVGDSLVLRTEMRTGSGTVAVTDALSFEPGTRGHDIGAGVPHALLRTVEGVEGEVVMEVVVAPRPEYGLTLPRWRRGDDGSWQCQAGPVGLRMLSEAPVIAEGGDLGGSFPVSAGERVAFQLAYAPRYETIGALRIGTADALGETVAGWQSWSDLHQRYQGRYRAQRRGARAGLVRGHQRVRRGVRLRPARLLRAPAAAGRVPPRRRPPDAGHHRGGP